MKLPSLAEWIASFKAFAAAMLALGIGFAADLDRPYWAMATAYITFQPQAGTTRAKGIYRLFGTLLGAAAAVALVPNLVNAPALLVAAMSAWVAICLTLSLLDRTPRGYVFLLAGYTTAIIGFPSVSAPDAIFATALARTEEISLGIICATLVASLILPRHIGPIIAQRTADWLRDGSVWTLDVLQEIPVTDAVLAYRRTFAADAVEIGVLTTQLADDAAHYRVTMQAGCALHARLLMLLPLLSSIADRLRALRAHGGVSVELKDLLETIADWIRNDPTAIETPGLQETIRRQQLMADKGTGWVDILSASLLMRLRELLLLVHDCRLLQAHIRARKAGLPKLAGGVEIEAAALQHRDLPMALFSGLSAGLAVALICFFWIASAWSEGAIAAVMTAVVCCFFAAQDDPAPAILQFMRWTVVAVLIDALYLFAVLPRIDGFPMLAVVLAPTFLAYGLLAARPATALMGLVLASMGATLLAFQPTYAADFSSFTNAAVATIFGMIAAAVVTRLVRSVGAEWSVWRLVRANWRSIAHAAERRGLGDRAAFAGLMLDRIGLVVMRLAKVSPEHMPNVRKLQVDLRIGLNIVDLRRARHALPPSAVAAIDGMLDDLATHYRALAAGPLSLRMAAPSPDLLARLDHAVTVVNATPSVPLRRDAMLGLVGIRLGLFPEASPYAPPPRAPAPLLRHVA